MDQSSGLLEDRYPKQELVGKGSFSEVYRAQDGSQLGTIVALKIAKRSQGDLENAFSREAERLLHLRHSHIVGLLDYTIYDHKPILIMEYVPHTLKEKYHPVGERQRALSPEQMLNYLLQAADALQYAHENEIVHRDIKPENILLTDDDQLKVSDFGIAIFLPEYAKNTKKNIGTPAYKAPEANPSEKADQYSLAVVVYEGLMGGRPKPWNKLRALFARLFATGPIVDLLPVVNQALAKNPDDRFNNVRDFAETFEQAYRRTQDRTYRPVRRTLIALLLVSFLILASLSIPLVSLIHVASGSRVTQARTIYPATPTPNATLTVNAGNQLYKQVTGKSPTFQSSLAEQDANAWRITSDAIGTCSFTDGGYSLSMQNPPQQKVTDIVCLEQARTFTDFAFQVDMTFANNDDSDYGGIVVRATEKLSYCFLIGLDQLYKFGIAAKNCRTLAADYLSDVHVKQNQSNRLTVIAQGSEISLYIDGQFLIAVHDTSLSQGAVGVSAEHYVITNQFPIPPPTTHVIFHNATLWVLP
jgi:serine/threonine protein kinase